jgi:hypothetical protein
MSYYRRIEADSFKQYVFNNLLAADILLNCIMGGRVRTISERIGEKKHGGYLSKWSHPLHYYVDKWILEPIDPGHSVDAYMANREADE